MYDSFFDDEATLDGRASHPARVRAEGQVCGDLNADAEYDRLNERSPEVYDESILQLSFESPRPGW